MEIFRLQIEVPILPRRKGIPERVLQQREIAQGSASLIIGSAYRRLSHITMTVSERIVAFPEEGRVLFI